MITAEEARKISNFYTFPEELEKGIKEACISGETFYVYSNKSLFSTQITALKLLGYNVKFHKDDYEFSYIIRWI